MRVSTLHTFEAGVERLQRRQSELLQAQEQMTTGKRVEKASDDPTAAAAAERALATVKRTEASQRALEASRTAITQSESSLGEASELMQQAREILVGAGNGSYSDVERRNLGTQLRGIRDQLLALANRGDGSGGFLFGGQGSATPPFIDAPGGVQFIGASGQQQTPAGEPMPVTLDGKAAWLTAPTGNGSFETRSASNSPTAWIDTGRVTDPSQLTGADYAVQFIDTGTGPTYSVLKDGNPTALTNVPWNGQDITFDGISVTVKGKPGNGDTFEVVPSTATLSVFDTLDRAANALATPLKKQAQIQQDNVFALRDLDQAMARLGTVRAAAGDTLNRLDSLSDRHDASKLAAETERAQATDLDMVHAISDFQAKQTGYDAALKSYSMVQRLTLFDHLNF